MTITHVLFDQQAGKFFRRIQGLNTIDKFRQPLLISSWVSIVHWTKIFRVVTSASHSIQWHAAFVDNNHERPLFSWGRDPNELTTRYMVRHGMMSYLGGPVDQEAD